MVRQSDADRDSLRLRDMRKQLEKLRKTNELLRAELEAARGDD